MAYGGAAALLAAACYAPLTAPVLCAFSLSYAGLGAVLGAYEMKQIQKIEGGING